MAQPSRRRAGRRLAPDRVSQGPSAGARTVAFLDRLQGAGRYTFTRAEIEKELRLSAGALKSLFWRLGRQCRVVAPHRGFYVIVTPEYRRAGSLPPSWFPAPVAPCGTLDREVLAWVASPFWWKMQGGPSGSSGRSLLDDLIRSCQ